LDFQATLREARRPDGQNSQSSASIHGCAGNPWRRQGSREGRAIQELIDAQHGSFALSLGIGISMANKLRKAKYDLNDAEIKPFFELGTVLENGVFFAANQLMELLSRKEGHPVYEADVRVFEVTDVNGKPLALFYCDYFKRDNKNGGAWMSEFVRQSKLLGTLPVIYNVANLPKPAPGEPALISFDDVTTMFSRVRSRAARHVCRHAVSDSLRHLDGARFCRIPVPVQ